MNNPSKASMMAVYIRRGRRWEMVGTDKDRAALETFVRNCFPMRAYRIEPMKENAQSA